MAITSDGGSTSYYNLPEGSTELNDLIEHKRMSFALGNIFKACYRLGEKKGNGALYDLKKIVFFANRLIALEEKRIADEMEVMKRAQERSLALRCQEASYPRTFSTGPRNILGQSTPSIEPYHGSLPYEYKAR